MFNNYLKIAIRTLVRYKAYTFINIFGLAIGISCCLLIVLFVQNEFRYDRFHKNLDDIYRVALYTPLMSGEIIARTFAPLGLGPTMTEYFPDIISVVRFKKDIPVLVRVHTQGFYEDGFLFADPSVFDVFSFQMVYGNPETALEHPFTVVLTETMAQKYFGLTNPIGQSIRVQNKYDYEVTGVVADVPHTSSIQFNCLASFATQYELRNTMMKRNDGWSLSAFVTYVRLNPGSSVTALNTRLKELVRNLSKRRGAIKANTIIRIEPFKEVYLHAKAENRLGPSRERHYLYIFSCVALLIVLIAAINYANLMVALSLRRAREVGTRKMVGATPEQVIAQFFIESLCTTLGAVLFAIALVELALPIFNQMVQRSLAIRYFDDFGFALMVFLVVLIVSLVAGSYPAVRLSRLQPTNVLKGSLKGGTHGSWFQKGLVVFQFAISGAFLVCTIIIQNQMGYIQNKELGMNAKQIVVVPIKGAMNIRQALTFKQVLLQDPHFSQATLSAVIPPHPNSRYSLEIEGFEEQIMVNHNAVDVDFLKTLQIDLKIGRNFSQDHSTDHLKAVLINEAFVARVGWDNPIGKEIKYGGNQKGTVIGVVRDFHLESLHHKIAPIFITFIQQDWRGHWPGYISVRIQTDDRSLILAQLKALWKRLAPDYPFEYFFLDMAFDQLYSSEQLLTQIFNVFFTLTIFIACLGLFGLSAHTAQQRTKELGIRKILGASVIDLVTLIVKDFIKLVFIGIAIGSPIAYFAMNDWLQNFVYRTETSINTILLAALISVLISFFTVSYQAIQAALKNPVETLRQE